MRFLISQITCSLSIYSLAFLLVPAAMGQIAPKNVPEEKLVHFGDVIDVDVLGSFEFDWRGSLNPQGFIDALNGVEEPVPALCRSEEQIASDIAKRYSKILRDPHVVVRIVDTRGRALASVDGAVKVPSRFRIKRPVTLRELIVRAGGVIDGASGNIEILRPGRLSCDVSSGALDIGQQGGLETLRVSIKDLLSGKPDADPLILSGDVVTVARASPIYVIGAVVNPNPIYLANSPTVTRAIATAGGAAKGAGNTAWIFRREGNSSTVIDVDLAKVRSGESADEILKPFDILEVAARGSLKRKYPPVAISAPRQPSGVTELPIMIVD